MAYDELEPIGIIDRIEYGLAQVCSLITNIAKSLWGKDRVMSKVTDFIPKWDQRTAQPKKQTIEEMKAIIMAIAGKK